MSPFLGARHKCDVEKLNIDCDVTMHLMIAKELGIDGHFMHDLYDFGCPSQTDGFNCDVFLILYIFQFTSGFENGTIDLSDDLDCQRLKT